MMMKEWFLIDLSMGSKVRIRTLTVRLPSRFEVTIKTPKNKYSPGWHLRSLRHGKNTHLHTHL